MFLGMMVEAKGLILNAAFLQEVYNNKPVSEIAALITTQDPSLNNDEFKQSLPFFHDGIFACTSRENMSAFLRTKLTPTFVAQTSQAKRQAQNYVDYISSSWGGEGSTSNDRDPACDSEEIDIILVDSDSDERKTLKIGTMATLKALFNQYAEERGVSLRSLRFSYDDKTLFLSSVGQKTPNDLGIKDSDVIVVTEQKQEVAPSASKPKANRRGSNSPGNSGMTRRKSVDDGKPRRNRRASWTGCPIDTSSEEFLKLKHSRKLTLLFEEAEPIFNKIRQELNDLSIQRCKPKRRVSSLSPPPKKVQPVNNPGSDGLGGKAGKVFYNVNVGQVENLYKTSKNGAFNASCCRSNNFSIDLHGHTREEALSKLDECLPEWKDAAMRGEYPFVVPVLIVCGGGAQVLSETVERWIKENDSVANAPKRPLRRRITMA
jgi:DNA-nicking Smr family endonuclease